MDQSNLSEQKALVRKLEDSFAVGVFKPTVVDMQQDYAADDEICLTSAVFTPDFISNKIIRKVIDPLKQIEPYHYFYPRQSMHLTIKNIRTISNPPLFSNSDIDKVDKLFKKIIPEFSNFDYYVEDILAFPTSVSVMAYARDTLSDLVLALDGGLKEIGVSDNKTYLSDSVFWGNITICRFVKKPGEKFLAAVDKMRNLKIGKFKVDKINLMTCNSVCYPASRKIISNYNLKNMGQGYR